MLTRMSGVTPEDMMAMQTDNYNVFAEMAVPVLLKNIKEQDLDAEGLTYLNLLKSWDFRNEIDSKAATIFSLLWNRFADTVYKDEYANAPSPVNRPFESTLLESILKDSAYKFLDNIETPSKETLPDDVTAAFKNSLADFKKGDKAGRLEWGKYKHTGVYHLLKLPAFSRRNLPIGGGTNCINAAKSDHGPSWRMIVSLTPQTEAYGVYPGGQSGNPGSIFYDNFIDQWAAGKYYTLWMMAKGDEKNERIKWKMSLSN